MTRRDREIFAVLKDESTLIPPTPGADREDAGVTDAPRSTESAGPAREPASEESGRVSPAARLPDPA
jgi:hypothetical protein